MGDGVWRPMLTRPMLSVDCIIDGIVKLDWMADEHCGGMPPICREAVTCG